MNDNARLRRVQEALALKTPDKVPFHAYESPELAMRVAGRPVHEMYLDPGSFIDAMIQSTRLFRNDIVSMRNDPFLIGEALTGAYECRAFGSLDDLKLVPADGGLQVHHRRDGALVGRIASDTKNVLPAKRHPLLIVSPADIEKIEVVPWREILQRSATRFLKRYVDEFKGRRFLLCGVGGLSANILDLYLGTEEAMVAAKTDPGFCRAIIDRHFELIKERILACQALGVDGIYTGDACASCSFFSPAIYRELFFHAHRRGVDFIHQQGMKALLHICGKINPILEDMAGTGADIIESLDAVSAGGDVDLRDAKRRIGHRVCLKGNIDAVHVIEPGPAEKVYQACRLALEAAGPGGYILSTEQITRDTPVEHVHAMIQARDDFAAASRKG